MQRYTVHIVQQRSRFILSQNYLYFVVYYLYITYAQLYTHICTSIYYEQSFSENTASKNTKTRLGESYRSFSSLFNSEMTHIRMFIKRSGFFLLFYVFLHLKFCVTFLIIINYYTVFFDYTRFYIASYI